MHPQVVKGCEDERSAAASWPTEGVVACEFSQERSDVEQKKGCGMNQEGEQLIVVPRRASAPTTEQEDLVPGAVN